MITALPARIILCAALLSTVPAGAIEAQTRRLQIEIEPIIILNCVEQIEYTLDTAQVLAAGRPEGQSADTVRTYGGAAQRIEARFAADTILNKADSSAIDIVINDACSLRGLGRGEGFVVDVKAANEGVLINPAANGALAIREARGKPDYAGHFASRFTIPQNRIRLDRAINLDVALRVDIQYANGSGRYSSPVDGVFSIEVSAP